MAVSEAPGPPGGALPVAPLCYFPEGTDPDGILLHPSAPRWVVANRTACQIVEKVTAPGGGTEAAETFLVDEYGIARGEAQRDVALALQGLGPLGLGETEGERRPRMGALGLVLTERCNLACRHCYGGYPTARELPLDTVHRLVEELMEGGGTLLTLTGGEPLVYRGLEEVLARVGKRLKVRFCTNGTLLDARLAGLLARDLDPLFQVSLDGPDADTHDAIRGAGTFQGALRGIGHLQDAGLGDRITLATTIQRRNKDRLPEMVALAERLGVKTLRLLPLRREGRARETWPGTGDGLDARAYEEIFDQFLGGGAFHRGVEVGCGLSGFTLVAPSHPHGDEIWCTVGSQLVVDADGQVYPCAVLMREDCRLGTVHEASLAELVAGEPLARLHAIRTRRKDEIPRCRPCLWRNLCQSGCMALALGEKGTLWDVDGHCAYRDAAYRRAFKGILARAPEAGRD